MEENEEPACSPTIPTDQKILVSNENSESWLTEKGLHISHLNVHYLYPKLDEIKLTLNMQSNIDIFCTCETFLNPTFSNNEIEINGYTLFRRDRQSHGGGLVIYCKNRILCTRRDELEMDDLETMWLEVKQPGHKQTFLLCYCYRPPSEPQNWLLKFESCVERAMLENKELIVLGDFNYDLLRDSSNTSSKHWLELTNTLNLVQVITSPTRVTSTSKSLIDHVYSSVPDYIIETSVPSLSISDHYPVCVTRKISNAEPTGPLHTVINYRHDKHFSLHHFLQSLCNQDWSIIEKSNNVDTAMSVFNSIFNAVLDKHAPRKRKRVKKIKQPNWMNKDITTAMRTRDKLHKQGKMTEYRLWRNKVKALIQHAKKEHYSNTINCNHHNPKLLWKNLHELTDFQKKGHSEYIIDQGGDLVTDPVKIGDLFNTFFTSIPETHIDNSHRSPNEFYDDQHLRRYIESKIPISSEFVIPLVTIEFVEKQLSLLNISKSTGLDGISAKYLKLAAPVIKFPLTFLLNLSITTGVFPSCLKVSKVTPLFKSGSKSDKNNYRPISVLPVLSSIFERHVKNCLVGFLETYDLIYKRQSGFRRQHSCQTALSKIIDDWSTYINLSEYVGTVFLDLSKAFDLVSHTILLKKLAMYKFSSLTLSWFESYLSSRTQQVSISGKLSQAKSVSAGVPQGSVLGPVLFILYVNDMFLHTNSCVLDMFADDTTLSTHSKSFAKITQDLNLDIENISNWCHKNHMVINASKTKAMIVGTKKALSNKSNNLLSLSMNGIDIGYSETEKLLGVTVDKNLSWSVQISNTIKKCNSLLFLLNRMKMYLSIQSRILFFNAYIQPHLDYCSTIWGNISSHLNNLIIKFQKRAARSILDADMSTPSSELFAKLNWLKFPERVKFNKSVLMYKIMHGMSPSYLQESFSYTREIHTYTLRSTTDNLLYIPKPNCELYRQSLSYSGSVIWNSIPEHIRNAPTIKQFKHMYLNYTRTISSTT